MVDQAKVRCENMPILLHDVFGRWIALFARFGSVKTLDDWHVEMYLLIWRSLGFAQLDLIWKKKNQKRTTLWSLFQFDTNHMFEM